VTGPLFGEALTALFVTCRALAYWIAAGAFAATVVCVVGVAGAAWAWRRARRGLCARLRPEVPAEAPRLLPAPERPAGARSANPSPHNAA
jgi:hypothetical protein